MVRESRDNYCTPCVKKFKIVFHGSISIMKSSNHETTGKSEVFLETKLRWRHLVVCCSLSFFSCTLGVLGSNVITPSSRLPIPRVAVPIDALAYAKKEANEGHLICLMEISSSSL